MNPNQGEAAVQAAVMCHGVLFESCGIIGNKTVGVVWWENDTRYVRGLMWDQTSDGEWVSSIPVDQDEPVFSIEEPIDLTNEAVLEPCPTSAPVVSVRTIEERHIRRVANALSLGVEPRDIRGMMQCEGMSDDEAFLCYVAGKLMFEKSVNPDLEETTNRLPVYLPKG